MKKHLLLLLFAFVFFGSCKSGSKRNVSLARFVELTAHGDISMVNQIISDYDYKMLDSMTQGFMSKRLTTYMAGDGERRGEAFVGDLLKCTIDDEHKMVSLQFITTHKRIYEDMKKEVGVLKFIPESAPERWGMVREVDLGNKEDDQRYRRDNIILRTFILKVSGVTGYVFEIDKD